MTYLPLISVIIPTLNEEKNIGRCLESIKNQTYPEEKIEIIVVDNNSTDKTKEIAKGFTPNVYNFPNLSKIRGIKNFRGAQLNFGVKKTKGEIIFFPDADMTFDESLIDEAVGSMEKYDALYVPEIIIGRGLFGKIRNFERSFYNQTCIDAVRVVKRDIFLKTGGFDTQNIDFGPDDWDFTKTLKKNSYKLGIIRKPLFHHEVNLTFKSYIRKKRKYANTFRSYIEKWGEYDPDIKKQFGFYYRYFGVFIENGKWRKMISKPLLALGMYCLRLLVGINYIKIKYG